MNFTRGTVVHHKIMGKGIALRQVDEGGEKKIEVRMANGQLEKFFPEELETDEEVQARERKKTEEIVRANKENAKRWRF